MLCTRSTSSKWYKTCVCFRTNEFREKIDSLQEEIHQLDMDIEENQGEARHTALAYQHPG